MSPNRVLQRINHSLRLPFPVERGIAGNTVQHEGREQTLLLICKQHIVTIFLIPRGLIHLAWH
jgi:hypothetical protein